MARKAVRGPVEPVTEAWRVDSCNIHYGVSDEVAVDRLIWAPSRPNRSLVIAEIVFSCVAPPGLLTVTSGPDVILPTQYWTGAASPFHQFRPPVCCREAQGSATPILQQQRIA